MMKAIPAIYEDGNIYFQFAGPSTDGPVAVLVIFPEEIPEPLHLCPDCCQKIEER